MSNSSEGMLTTSTIPQDLTIECQCGDKATIRRVPADVIDRRIVYVRPQMRSGEEQ